MKSAAPARRHQSDPVAGSSVKKPRSSAVPLWRPMLATALAAVTTGVVALVTALLLGGGGPQPTPDGLPDAGLVTGWALPLARLAFDVGAIGTIGALLLAAVLLGPLNRSGGVDHLESVDRFDSPDGTEPDRTLSPLALRATRAASWAAAGWCAATLALLVLSLSDLVGAPVGTALSEAAPASLLWTAELPRSLMLTVVAALALVVFARWTVTRTGAFSLLGLAVAALVPVLFSGHAATASDHDLATSSLIVHVVSAALWVGGLLALLVCARADMHVLAGVLPRFSTLALGCFIAVGLSGALSAFVRLGWSVQTWVSPYGGLLVAKSLALVLLGWMGYQHRRRAVPAVLAGRPRAFLRLAGAEIVVMAMAFGLAVALGRTPTPAAGVRPVPEHGSGHATLSWEVLPWSPARLLTEWRLDAIVITAVGLAVVAYLVAVRRLAQRGQRWPVRRTASAMAGLATATFVLCGGVASYSTALFSMQVAQLLTMATVVPILLTLGRPLALRREVHEVTATGATNLPGLPSSTVVRLVSNPANGLLVLVVLIVGLYVTPLFEMSLRHFALHLLVNVLVLTGGLAFFSSVLAVDMPPERRELKDRVMFLAAFLLFLAAFGAVLVTSEGLYGARWFTELGWFWADPAADQQLGGIVVWTYALALSPLTVVLLSAQSRLRDRSQRAR